MYNISLHKRASKKIKTIQQKTAKQIILAIDALQQNPFNNNLDIKKLSDSLDIFRCRVGKYRIIYIINSKNKTILITRIEHRQWDYKFLFDFFL